MLKRASKTKLYCKQRMRTLLKLEINLSIRLVGEFRKVRKITSCTFAFAVGKQKDASEDTVVVCSRHST